MVQLVHIVSAPAGSCICQNNATEPGNGQFMERIEIKAPAGMTWVVDQAIDFYSTSSPPPPGDPIPMPVGTVLDYDPINAMEGTYYIEGLYISGQDFQVRFRSDEDDYEYIDGKACVYGRKYVDGPRALCSGGIGQYSIPSNGAVQYDVFVKNGMVISTSNNGATATVDWSNPNPDKEIRFVSKYNCEDPAILQVTTGNSDLAMYCRSTVNVSLDEDDCAFEVKPKHLIAGNPQPNAAYAVMLIEPDGSPSLDNILDASHIGKTIMAKLIDGCSR